MTDFLIWYYMGLGSIGGWLIFLVLGIAGIIIIFAHSASRRIPATAWKVIACVGLLLIIPAIVFRFATANFGSALSNFTDAFFYMGILAGILPFVLAIGYLVVYRGMVSCGNGHIYDQRLGACPDCPPPMIVTRPPVLYEPETPIYVEPKEEQVEYKTKPKASAWLVDPDGKSIQLFEEETTIGRSSENDIKLDDKTVGRRHAKITTENGHYRLIDLGSVNFTRVNGHIIRKPTLIESEDEIQFGDDSNFIFKS